MRKSKFFLGLMAVLAVACVAEPKETPQLAGDEELVAGIENSGTRTVVDADLQVLWETGDQISVFLQTTENRPYALKGEGGVASGKFARTTKPSSDFYASVPFNFGVYPYSEETKIDAEGVITVTLPAEQPYAEASFGSGANVMVAASEDKMLKFKNVGGYVGVRLTGDVAVESIALRANAGEPLAGPAQVTISPDGEPTMTLSEEGAVETVTVACEKPVQLSAEETIFWVVVPPAEYVEGFTLTVTYNEGKEFVLEGSESLDLPRSTLVKMAPINIVAPKTLPYVEPFDKEFGAFTVDDVELDELSYVWTIDKGYKVAKASAFVSNVAHAVESRLVSPPIDLTAEKQAVLSFDFMLRYGVPASYNDQLYLEVVDGEDVTKVKIPEMPDYDPKFAKMSSVIDLTPFCGKVIQLAFVYNTKDNDGQIPTFEVANAKFDRELETVITAPAAMTFSVGDSPVALGAYANSGATLTFASSDETVARVNAKGLVTPLAEGTATITITAPATGIYAAAEATCVVTVLPESAVDYSVVYTSNVELSAQGGTSASECVVNVGEESYDGLKAGTGKVQGALVVTVPKGTTKLHLHAFGWNKENVTLSISGGNVSPASVTLVSDSGVANNSPFTLTTTDNSYYCITLSDVTADTDITFTATVGKRFILWGVNAE